MASCLGLRVTGARGYYETEMAEEESKPAERMAEVPPAGTKVPPRRFGRTEIQMPVLTCGG